jgi:hypothetical protein
MAGVGGVLRSDPAYRGSDLVGCRWLDRRHLRRLRVFEQERSEVRATSAAIGRRGMRPSG